MAQDLGQSLTVREEGNDNHIVKATMMSEADWHLTTVTALLAAGRISPSRHEPHTTPGPLWVYKGGEGKSEKASDQERPSGPLPQGGKGGEERGERPRAKAERSRKGVWEGGAQTFWNECHDHNRWMREEKERRAEEGRGWEEWRKDQVRSGVQKLKKTPRFLKGSKIAQRNRRK